METVLSCDLSIWNSYNLATFIVNCLIAIGTCGAVIRSLWTTRERGKGVFYCSNIDKGEYKVHVKIENTGRKDIFMDEHTEIILKLNKHYQSIPLKSLEDDAYMKRSHIPSKTQKLLSYDASAINNPGISLIKKVLDDPKCKAFIYTSTRTPLELKIHKNID